MNKKDTEFRKSINETADETVKIKDQYNNLLGTITDYSNQIQTKWSNVKTSSSSIRKSRITIFTSRISLLKAHRLLRIKNRLTIRINNSYVKSKPLFSNLTNVISRQEASFFSSDQIMKINGILCKCTKSPIDKEERKQIVEVLEYTINLLKTEIDNSKTNIKESKATLEKSKNSKAKSMQEIKDLTKEINKLINKLNILKSKMENNMDNTSYAYRAFIDNAIKIQKRV